MKEPEKRIGVFDKKEIKNHPFFHDLDWDKLLLKEYESPYYIDANYRYDPKNGKNVIKKKYIFLHYNIRRISFLMKVILKKKQKSIE